MNRKIFFLINLMVAGTALLLCVSAYGQKQQRKPWSVPENSQKSINPVKSNSESLATGKALYGQHCKSCHGKAGEGDGPKAAELKTFPGDFTTTDFHKQTDGEIFYKTSEGREDMPSFKKKISDPEDIWAIINYVRSLNQGN
jgi:mono/diheme cytochrome c family protein